MLRTFAAALAASCFACAQTPNTLSPEEKSAGFRLLFNGNDLMGWKAPGKNWQVRDGAIAGRPTGHGQQLYYAAETMPDDFELRFEWKVSPGGNSGVYYRPGQYEYQILDNQGHSDGKDPRTSAAALYYFTGPERDVTRPVGEWNEGRIVCRGTLIEHWLNGVKVVDVDYSRPVWKDAVERMLKRGGDVKARGGTLFFQDHTGIVWYRSIRLRKLAP